MPDALDRQRAYVEELEFQGKHPWEASPAQQHVMHYWWLSHIHWQCAFNYVEGVLQEETGNGYPMHVIDQCEALCTVAEDWQLRAIRLQSEVEMGARVPLSNLVEMPVLQIDAMTRLGVWGVQQAVIEQVASDQAQITKLGLPGRFDDVMRHLLQVMEPERAIMDHLRETWLDTTSNESQLDLVRHASQPSDVLFRAGQQLWTPYLSGTVYVESLRKKTTAKDLRLGFDPWCLTDDRRKLEYSSDSAKQQELADFWESLASPKAAVELKQQLDEAHRNGRIRLRTGRGYGIAPWQSQYLVRYPISIGGRTFSTGELIALFVGPPGGNGKRQVEVRRTGRLSDIFDLLGQKRP